MSAEIEMELSRVEIHEGGGKQLIALREKGGERTFQIVIGYGEAAEIHRKLTNQQPLRPMTHDLLGALLTATESEVSRVVVSDLIEATYYAEIHITKADGSPETLDARPSDAIALAVQVHAPIFVAEPVLDQLTEGL